MSDGDENLAVLLVLKEEDEAFVTSLCPGDEVGALVMPPVLSVSDEARRVVCELLLVEMSEVPFTVDTKLEDL